MSLVLPRNTVAVAFPKHSISSCTMKDSERQEVDRHGGGGRRRLDSLFRWGFRHHKSMRSTPLVEVHQVKLLKSRGFHKWERSDVPGAVK
eukprot:6466304-Amphidinium_carterae.1